MAHNFVAKLKPANLASKSDIVDLVKKTNFDDKLINLNKIATLNKTVHSPVQDELNEISVKVELTSIVFLVVKNIFLQVYYKIIRYLYQLMNTLNSIHF